MLLQGANVGRKNGRKMSRFLDSLLGRLVCLQDAGGLSKKQELAGHCIGKFARDRTDTGFMAKSVLHLPVLLCCSVVVWPATSNAQAQAPPQNASGAGPRLRTGPITNVSVDGSEAMFTTMCALLAAGFESDVSAANWHPLRAQLRERMQHQQGPAVDALREFYKKHQLADAGAMLSQYVWFGLVSGPAPKFELTLRRDELPPEVIALEGFSEILSAYYQEQKLGRLWRGLRPLYKAETQRMADAVLQLVFVAPNYLREVMSNSHPRTFMVMVMHLLGRI